MNQKPVLHFRHHSVALCKGSVFNLTPTLAAVTCPRCIGLLQTTRSTQVRWTPDQIRSFVADVRREVGGGWAWLTPRVQRALMAERALTVVREDLEAIRIADIDALLDAMIGEANIPAGPCPTCGVQ